MNEKKPASKHGNERPVSLHPMEFEEAVGALLEAKPETKNSPAKDGDPSVARKEASSD